MRRRLGSCSAEDLREDLRRCARHLVVTWVALGFFASGARADGEASGVQSTRTAKERLGGKASDEQRVHNCKVHPDQRGLKSHPDDYRDGRNKKHNTDTTDV